ncbi:hypothetical protein TOPH_02791 [Tolypocladium ophioglossoides CBS 100239]|uniref:Uncharacterized protein n=1 Tax=Tolypocladium ophioglossoides (strain CBS 100239) TaxID=1163406 RepID=A0A0L0NFQ1_TOLOC|nr:hypothetical protein TOPH_02791 [Tolypocladium ophioglossoides CBS 100239]
MPIPHKRKVSTVRGFYQAFYDTGTLPIRTCMLYCRKHTRKELRGSVAVELHKIGYFILNNAKNNDTALEIIGRELGFVGARRRGRCFRHTLNLSAKAILFSHDANAFERRFATISSDLLPTIESNSNNKTRLKGAALRSHAHCPLFTSQRTSYPTRTRKWSKYLRKSLLTTKPLSKYSKATARSVSHRSRNYYRCVRQREQQLPGYREPPGARGLRGRR